MAQIAIAPNTSQFVANGARELLGVKSRPSGTTSGVRDPGPEVYFPDPESRTPDPVPVKVQPSELEKAVRRMPTLYVIAFFGVVVACAVLIIWNTLQVNRLTTERNKLDDQIAQTEQRLIRLRADEMQLSAESRVRQIAQNKLGMVEANGDDIIVAH
jgi:cell division protein FtsL